MPEKIKRPGGEKKKGKEGPADEVSVIFAGLKAEFERKIKKNPYPRQISDEQHVLEQIVAIFLSKGFNQAFKLYRQGNVDAAVALMLRIKQHLDQDLRKKYGAFEKSTHRGSISGDEYITRELEFSGWLPDAMLKNTIDLPGLPPETSDRLSDTTILELFRLKESIDRMKQSKEAMNIVWDNNIILSIAPYGYAGISYGQMNDFPEFTLPEALQQRAADWYTKYKTTGGSESKDALQLIEEKYAIEREALDLLLAAAKKDVE